MIFDSYTSFGVGIVVSVLISIVAGVLVRALVRIKGSPVDWFHAATAGGWCAGMPILGGVSALMLASIKSGSYDPSLDDGRDVMELPGMTMRLYVNIIIAVSIASIMGISLIAVHISKYVRTAQQ